MKLTRKPARRIDEEGCGAGSRAALRHWAMAVPVIWVVLLFVGCASRWPRADRLPPPPSEEMRGRLGCIGIATGAALTNVLIREPLSPAAKAGQGAGAGFLWGVGAGWDAGRGKGVYGAAASILTWAVAVPAGTVAGALTGHARGESITEFQFEEAEPYLRGAIAALGLNELISQHLLEAIENRTPHPTVALGRASQVDSSETVNYRSLAGERIDTLLEATVAAVGLAGERSADAPLTVFMSVRVSLIRVKDGAELHRHTWNYRGGAKTLAEWAEERGGPLREELDRAVPRLVDKVVDHLFLR